MDKNPSMQRDDAGTPPAKKRIQTPLVERDLVSEERLIRIGDLSLLMSVPIGQEESGPRISFWYQITSASLALARYLYRRGRLDGQRVLELGAGLGLAGVTAGKLGASVTFSDYMEMALAFARRNADHNQLTRARFCKLDWEHPTSIDRHDLIIGSEILYDYFFHDSLKQLLLTALTPGGSMVFADRRRLVVDRFLGRLVDEGFSCEESIEQIEEEGFERRTISVFRLLSARGVGTTASLHSEESEKLSVQKKHQSKTVTTESG